jgi:hypothetical protein
MALEMLAEVARVSSRERARIAAARAGETGMEAGADKIAALRDAAAAFQRLGA